MFEEVRPLYDYLGPRWGGGSVVHLEFTSRYGLQSHVEVVQDNIPIPAWIVEKLTEENLEEIEGLFAYSKPRREAVDAALAAMLAAEEAALQG